MHRSRLSGSNTADSNSTFHKRVSFAAGLVAMVLLAGCSGTQLGDFGQDKSDEREVAALGRWEQYKSQVSGTAYYSSLIQAGDEYFGVSVVDVVEPTPDEINNCANDSNAVTGRIVALKLVDEVFEVQKEVELVNVWIDGYTNSLEAFDITEDGVEEVFVSMNCLAYPSLRAMTLVNLEWQELSLGGATFIRDGMLLSYEKDCTPSCADGGVVTKRYAWDGAAVSEMGLAVEDGTVVDLNVSMTCTTFNTATALPLKQCDEGPLVRQFLVLAAKVVGDYGDGASVTHVPNRIDEQVAKWINTYRYRHGLEVKKEVDGELFAKLGGFWNPESQFEKDLFERYCQVGLSYECEQFGYLFPTEDCPKYRFSYGDKWPIQRCDYGGWVFVLSAALSPFDGQRLTDDRSGVFDANLEQRVRDFQQAQGLEVDGLVGRNTWRALYEYPGSPIQGMWDSNGDGLFGPGDILPD